VKSQAELIVTTASDEAIASLNAYLPPMQTAAATRNVDAYFWANTALRDVEIANCGNTQVKRILDSLGLRTMQLRHLSLSQPGRLEQSLVNRQLQVKAYEKRDAPLAMALARSTVLGALAAIERSGWTGSQRQSDDDVA
jgi:DNA-binding GntR family transcriptional regulator